MVIPELVRLLMGRGIAFEDAAAIVERACGYTNHTILAEALETWPMGYLEQVAPGIVPVIRQLDELARTRTDDERVAVIDASDVVHMANMDVHFSHAVNGVAALHTQILVESEMRPFAELYPEKFSNKTNGITFRRWLMGCNPALAGLVTSAIGDGWKRATPRGSRTFSPCAGTSPSRSPSLTSRDRTRSALPRGSAPRRTSRWTRIPSLTSRSSACTSTSVSR